jgi:hypothetical protein
MPILIFILFVVWFILISAAKTSFPVKTGSVIPEELELNSVRDALIEKQGWPLERVEAARAEYVRFLFLLQRKPGFMLIPWRNEEGQDDLDQFWHQHILDTAKYAADCNALFGRMIHHNPHVVRGSGNETDAVENVWSAAGLQAESLSWVVGLRKCIRPVCGAELLAIMESAHRWSTKTAELKKFAFSRQT